MSTRTIAVIVLLLFVGCLMLAVFTEQAKAVQGGYDPMADANKKDKPKAHKTELWKMAVGFGSIFVMIAVMKWL